MPKETDLDLPVSVQESPAKVWFSVGLLQRGGTQCSSSWDVLKEVTIIFITSTRVWPQVKQQGRNTAPLINRKLD